MKIKILLIMATILTITAMFAISTHCATGKKTKGYQVKEVDRTQTMFVYQFRSYAWQYQDYAYLISPDGNVVYVDINKEKGKNFPVGTEETLQFFDEYKKSQEDTKHQMVTKTSKALIRKGINLDCVKLEETSGRKIDGGIKMYYCVKGTGKARKMVLLEEAGENPRKTKNKNALRVVKYIKKAVEEARIQEMDTE